MERRTILVERMVVLVNVRAVLAETTLGLETTWIRGELVNVYTDCYGGEKEK